MSYAYARLLNVGIHLHKFDSLDDEQLKRAANVHIRQWKRIYSSVRSFALVCDPPYLKLGEHLNQSVISQFTDMGSDFISDFHNALEKLLGDEEHGKDLIHEYMDFSMKPDKFF